MINNWALHFILYTFMRVYFTTQLRKVLKKDTGLYFKSELNDHVINNSSKKYQRTFGWKNRLRWKIIHTISVLPQNIFYLQKEKSYLYNRKSSGHHLNQMIKLNISNEHQHKMLPDKYIIYIHSSLRMEYHLCNIITKILNLNLVMVVGGEGGIRQLQFEEHSSKQQVWTLKRQKMAGGQGNCSRLKGTKGQ